MRWYALALPVFMRKHPHPISLTGKRLEKYNVENLNLESGGGEYPTQDGFGWTNGVYLAFYHLYRKE